MVKMAATNQSARDGKATGYILLSIIGFSSIPAFVSWSGGSEAPFLFNASLRIGHALGYLLFLLVFYVDLVFSRHVLSTIWSRLFTWKLALLLTAVAYFDLGLFALSSRFVDVSVTAVLFETSTIFIIYLMAWIFRKERRFRKLTPTMIPMLLLAFAGFVFVVASQSGGFGVVDGTDLPRLVIGISLAIIGALVSALSVFGFRWGANLSRELPRLLKGHLDFSLRSIPVRAGRPGRGKPYQYRVKVYPWVYRAILVRGRRL